MPKEILHLDMDAFFASVEQRDNPSLRGKPIAVGGGIGKRTVVATSSYEARALGVKTAMSTTEALRLCPQLIVIVGNIRKYAAISKKIFAYLTHYTDLVEIFSIDDAFMDVTHSKHLFGSARIIAEEIKKGIREEHGLTASIGIGPTKTIAKLASRMKKPNGLVEVRPEEVPHILENLPVEELCGIGNQLKKHLRRLGVRTVGELSRFPKEELTRHFRPALGEWLWRLGRGDDGSPVRPYILHDAAKSMGHSYTLPHDTVNREEVKTYLLQLSEHVGMRLRSGGYRGHVVSTTVRYADFETVSFQRDIHFYTNDGYAIYKYASGLLEEYAKPKQPIRLVGVTLSGLMKEMEQLSLLYATAPRDSLLNAFDTINKKWGKGTLTRARLLGNELSEKCGMTPREAYGK